MSASLKRSHEDMASQSSTPLTVLLNNGDEIWRSPPSAKDDDDETFAWQDGWIEVQRRITPQPQSHSIDHANFSGSSSQLSHCWTTEFHPPDPTGGKKRGKPKILKSIKEVKKYLNSQKPKEEVRFTRERPSRPSRRSRNNLSDQHEFGDMDGTNEPRQGTDEELREIMNQDDEESTAMRKSIILAAVLARKKDELYGNPKFVGSNGHIYPDLRSAFGKFAEMKACSVCKQRVQGAFFCRLKHMHLDVPDFDDGETNSAECLKPLFLNSIEELEQRQSCYSSGGKVVSSNSDVEKSQKDKFNSGEALSNPSDSSDCSLDKMGDDLLYHIASFLPNWQQLVNFSWSSKRSRSLVFDSVHSEKLFRGVFVRAFGEAGTLGKFETDLSWRERWIMIKNLRSGLKAGNEGSIGERGRMRQSIGVLLPQEERDALYYDNPDVTPDGTCIGYFGLVVLRLPRPPNASDDWQPPVALRGDFNGLRIFNSLEDAVMARDPPNDGSEQVRFTSVGVDSGQVLSLLQTSKQMKNDGECPVCCFIGCASGRVSALSATLSDSGDGYIFHISASHHAHEDEVTALTYVNCSSNSDEDIPILFSACCGGKVYFYPHALDAASGFSMDEAVLTMSNNFPIYSMASCVISSEDRKFSVLCTGDRGGNIRLWQKKDVDLVTMCTSRSPIFLARQLCKSSTQRGTCFHSVTRIMFIHNNVLVTGTNSGDVRIWQLRCEADATKWRKGVEGKLPKLTLSYDFIGGHNGTVELMTSVGDVLLTSGGNDGQVIGWDITRGLRLGSVSCHPGLEVEEVHHRVKSCVVDVLVNGKEGKLTSLCRDGTLQQWTFGGSSLMSSA